MYSEWWALAGIHANKNFTHSTKCVAQYLFSVHLHANGFFPCSIETMCETLKMSRCSAIRAIKELEAAGVLEVRRGGRVGNRNLPNYYKFKEFSPGVKLDRSKKKTSSNQVLEIQERVREINENDSILKKTKAVRRALAILRSQGIWIREEDLLSYSL